MTGGVYDSSLKASRSLRRGSSVPALDVGPVYLRLAGPEIISDSVSPAFRFGRPCVHVSVCVHVSPREPHLCASLFPSRTHSRPLTMEVRERERARVFDFAARSTCWIHKPRPTSRRHPAADRSTTACKVEQIAGEKYARRRRKGKRATEIANASG